MSKFDKSSNVSDKNSNVSNVDEVIWQILQSVYSSLDLDEIFQQVVNKLGKHLNTDRCFITRYDQKTGVLVPPSREYRSSEKIESILNADPELWKNLELYAKNLCESSHAVAFEDYAEQGVPSKIQERLSHLRVQSNLACVIRFQGECLALLFIHQVTDMREWTDADKEILTQVAHQSATAIHHAVLHQQLKSRSHRQAVVTELYKQALSGMKTEKFLEQALTTVMNEMNMPFSKIVEYQPGQEKSLTFRIVKGFDPSLVGQAFDPGEEPHAHYTLECKQPIAVQDINQETRFKSSPLHRQYHLVSGITAVIFGESKPFGVLQIDSQEKRSFTESDIFLVQAVANAIGIVMERKDAEALIQQTEERYRLTVENITDYSISLQDIQGNLMSWNIGSERLFGYTPTEMIGQHFSILFPPENRNQETMSRELSIAAQQGRYECEGWRLRKDGTRFWASVVVNALHQDGKGILGYSKVIRDISERKKADDALLEYQAKLEESNRDLEIFASMASHDLKAPLRKVKFFSDRIYETNKNRLDDEAIDHFQRMHRSLDSMQDLIDNLLALSLATRSNTHFEPVDLTWIINKVLSDLSVQIQEKQATVEVDSLFSVNGDALQLQLLFQNLIENSLKFQLPDRKPHIKISATCKNNHAYQLTLQDNGLGFPAEHSQKIFGVFERLHSKSDYPGTGLGLAICKRIVERHGGTITALSELDQGATFLIKLPACTAQPVPSLEAV